MRQAIVFPGQVDRALRGLKELRRVCPEAFEEQIEREDDDVPARYVVSDGRLFVSEGGSGGFVGAWDGEGFEEACPELFGLTDDDDAYDVIIDAMFSTLRRALGV